MFTGIVEATGIVTALRRAERGLDLYINPVAGFEVQMGDSVSVNGVCLTVVSRGPEMLFNVSPETLRSTNLGGLRIRERVNLERAMRMGDRFGGHLVTGHVDGVGRIVQKRREGDYTLYIFEASPDILKYMVVKGSVAVDGISLTITRLDNRSFSVAIIPHTLEVTNIGSKGIGDTVNIEVDIIGKYVERFLKREKNDNLMGLLKEGGFIG